MADPTTQVTQQALDPGAQDYRDYVYGQAQNLPQWQQYGGQTVAGPSQQTQQGYQQAAYMDPRLQQAYGGAAQNLGMAQNYLQQQLGPGASFANADMAAYQNPYQQQVIGAAEQDYQRMMGQGIRDVGAQATSAGAFGGSRHGQAEAQRMALLQNQQAGTMAGIRHTGFQDAANRWQQDRLMGMQGAGALANLGLAGAQGLNQQQMQQAQANVAGGEYGRGIQQQGMTDQYNQWLMAQQAPYQRLAAQTQAGSAMPYGQTTTQQMQYDDSKGFGDFLGGAATGAGIGSSFGPWGTAIGGLLGGIGSIF